MIHSPKEWEAYRETITIKGRGGTDFRPVFQKVEELRKQHVFRNLKALIYFTDGDGIYPEQKARLRDGICLCQTDRKMNLVPKWGKKTADRRMITLCNNNMTKKSISQKSNTRKNFERYIKSAQR